MKFQQSPPGFRNVSGPIVQTLQASLNAAGIDAGTEDGVWGRTTMNALKAWQNAQGSEETGVVDEQVWAALVATPVPDLPSRALQLTGVWEGTGYGGANGNFDGQGITWGVWTTPCAMRRAGWICLVFGVFLGGVGLSSLYGFSQLDVDKAESFERRHVEQMRIEEGKDPTTDTGTISSGLK